MQNFQFELREVCKQYPSGNGVLPVLKGVSLQVASNDFLAIFGPSGSGKSTLLNIIGCLDRWDSGSYRLGEHRVENAGDDYLAAIRRNYIGFVFQFYNLIPRLNALRNLELAMVYGEVPYSQRQDKALKALEQVGVAARAHATPGTLSGGEQQRVAIARALINDPQIIVLDEPTGNLDSESGTAIMELLRALNASGRTIVAVTHDPAVAKYANRIFDLRDGLLTEQR